MEAVERACSVAVGAILEAHSQRCGPIACAEEEWSTSWDAFAARDGFYAAMLPTEQDAIKMLFVAFDRLRKLGWREAIYCPKDGSAFDAIECDSTGIHRTHYSGEWPTGTWLIEEEGDLSPSRPVLYRPTEAEITERERRLEAYRAARLSQPMEAEHG